MILADNIHAYKGTAFLPEGPDGIGGGGACSHEG